MMSGLIFLLTFRGRTHLNSAATRSRLTPPALSEQTLQQLNPIALAFLGDAVYELVVRQLYLMPPKRINDYHEQVVAQVRAEQQSLHLGTLEPYLNAIELDWVRRGRNASPKSRRANPGQYQRSTGLETLIGYLYLTDQPRLEELLSYLELELEIVAKEY
jgi:ribonuclease III family protein